jgi:avermectin B 5-O-methyltransferase
MRGTELADRLTALLQLECSSRVLDFSCGDGAAAVKLAWSLGCRVVGVDPSQLNVEAATRMAAERGVDSLCTFVRGDPERIELGDGRFDAVICESSLDSFPDQGAAARQLARLLRPGGRLAIAGLTPTGPWDPDQSSAALRSAGLEPGRAEAGDDYTIVVAELTKPTSQSGTPV